MNELNPHYSFEVNISTVSEANCSEHWTKKGKRHKQQQYFVRLEFRKNVTYWSLPCSVTLTRLSPRLLDDDNLLQAFKYIRDEISDCLIPEKTGFYTFTKEVVTHKGIMKKTITKSIKGRADSDPRIKWIYKQEKNKIKAIRIEIVCEYPKQGEICTQSTDH